MRSVSQGVLCVSRDAYSVCVSVQFVCRDAIVSDSVYFDDCSWTFSDRLRQEKFIKADLCLQQSEVEQLHHFQDWQFTSMIKIAYKIVQSTIEISNSNLLSIWTCTAESSQILAITWPNNIPGSRPSKTFKLLLLIILVTIHI